MNPKYDIILADPPWDFKVWNKDTGSGRSPSAHYRTMDIKDICNFPVKDLCNKNSALFIWTVWPRLFETERVINAWGFKYKTLAWTWVKMTKDNSRPAMGMGHYTRANTEPCLLAVRGNMPVAAHDVLSLIMSPRGEHSAKPVEQYEKIDRLYPNTTRLELFARRTQPGWDVFGNEVENSITMGEQLQLPAR